VSIPVTLDPTRVLHLELAGRALRVEAFGAAALDAVTPALAHLETDRPVTAALRYRVWSDDLGVHPLWESDARGPARLGAHGLAMSRPDPPALEVFEPGRGIELWGTRAGLAAGDTRAHPAGTATAAWLATEGAQVLHVGAVAFDGAAVLVVGAGGTGKSTTVVASGLAGAGILGDDMCVVDVDATTGVAQVHALYATLKLNPDSAARLGVDTWPVLGVTPKGKRVLAIDAPLRLQASAPVGAIVALRAPDTEVVAPRHLRPQEAVRVLVPTGLNAALGAVALDDWFALAVRLARSVPAYEVSRSWDLARVVAGVASAVAGSR
jgi:hypothetical protein